MERVFIDREWCIAYTLLALQSINHSANKERSVNDFIGEIQEMFKIYTDESVLMQLMEKIILEEGENRIRIIRTNKKSDNIQIKK